VQAMSEAMKKLGIDQLNVEQRLALIEEIWDSIDADDSAAVQLSDAQRAELHARLLDDDANPDDVISWERIKNLTPPPEEK
jgi:putative addiction module component (TIGR02574 family)